MLSKDKAKNCEWSEEERGNEKPEIHQEHEFPASGNISVKLEMGRELYRIGLSNEAIARVLHLSEEAIEQLEECANGAEIE